MIQYSLNQIKQTRVNLLNTIQDLTLEQLNTIPDGFNNNIAWNLGHLLVTQQILCYQLTNNKMYVSEDYIGLFKKGTKARANYTNETISTIKKLLLSVVDELEKDINNNIFNNYTSYTTSYHVKLTTFEEAISFDSLHEALHYGYIMAFKRMLLK